MEFKVRHPSLLHGRSAVLYNGQPVQFDLDNGYFHVPEKYGKGLVDYLVRVEGWTDCSNYSAANVVERKAIDTSNFWTLKMPGSDDSKEVDGTVGMFVGKQERMIPVIRNLIHTKEKEVRDQLLRDGWTMVKSKTINFEPDYPFPPRANTSETRLEGIKDFSFGEALHGNY